MNNGFMAALHRLIVSGAVVAALMACDVDTASAPSPAAPQPVPREGSVGRDHDVRAPEREAPPPTPSLAQDSLPVPLPRQGDPEPRAGGQEGGGSAGFLLERSVRLRISDLAGRETEIHRLERVKILGTRVSIDDETFGRRLIIRPDLGLAWVIDRVDGTYSEVAFEAFAKRRAAVIAELKSTLARVEGSMDADPITVTLLRLGDMPETTPVTIRPTDRAEKVAGRDAVGREIRIGKEISYINVLVDPSLEGALGYFEALSKVGAFHPAVADRLKQLGGFPVRGDVRYALFFDLVRATEEVTSAVKADLADSDFDVPAKLKRVPLATVDPAAWTPPAKPKQFQRSFAEDEMDRERNPFRPDDKK
jgi:hypothetical protein